MDTKSLISFGYRLNASPFTHQSFDGEKKRKKKRKRKSDDHPHYVFFVVVVDSKRVCEPNVRGGHPRSSEWNETRAF